MSNEQEWEYVLVVDGPPTMEGPQRWIVGTFDTEAEAQEALGRFPHPERQENLRVERQEQAPNWEGVPGGTEHRTVGPHRAWCYQDATWCYEKALCPCCDQTGLPDRWRGLNVGDVLDELREAVDGLRQKGVEGAWNSALEAVIDLINDEGSDE